MSERGDKPVDYWGRCVGDMCVVKQREGWLGKYMGGRIGLWMGEWMGVDGRWWIVGWNGGCAAELIMLYYDLPPAVYSFVAPFSSSVSSFVYWFFRFIHIFLRSPYANVAKRIFFSLVANNSGLMANIQVKMNTFGPHLEDKTITQLSHLEPVPRLYSLQYASASPQTNPIFSMENP